MVPDRDSILRRLADPRFVEVEVAGAVRSVVVERTRPGVMHACTVDDILEMLEQVDAAHLVDLDLIVLRQPTRKQENLEPVWGSLRYYLQFGRHAGGALILDAVPETVVVHFDRKMPPDQQAELDRLQQSRAKVVETEANPSAASTFSVPDHGAHRGGDRRHSANMGLWHFEIWAR